MKACYKIIVFTSMMLFCSGCITPVDQPELDPLDILVLNGLLSDSDTVYVQLTKPVNPTSEAFDLVRDVEVVLTQEGGIEQSFIYDDSLFILPGFEYQPNTNYKIAVLDPQFRPIITSNTKSPLATVFFLSTNQYLLGQSIQISGKVVDHQSGENLIGAHVFALQNQGGGTNTNRYGFFSLNVQNTDSVTLTLSYLGYRQLDTVISRENLNSFLIFKLKEQSTALEEIRISDKKNNLSGPPGIVKLSKKKIEQTPSFFGENDLVKTLQFMPGVSSGSEGGSNIFVRGGTPDQNLFLLDNVPVYNINHLANFVSIFNSDAISHVELYKGSFPARYGGRLSSIVDVQMKEGNRKDFRFNGAIGPISATIK